VLCGTTTALRANGWCSIEPDGPFEGVPPHLEHSLVHRFWFERVADSEIGGWYYRERQLRELAYGCRMLVCEKCGSDDIDLVEIQADGRKEVICLSCEHSWVRGTPTTTTSRATTAPRVDTFAEAKRRFPGPENVDPVRLERVNRLKKDFLLRKPTPQPDVDAYWARYQGIFSREGLQSCNPQDLKDFANTATGARPGNMSVFNTAWNNIGVDMAVRRTRDTINYLL